MLYLDNSASTKILKEVYDEMQPYLTEYYGNPNSMYYELAIKSSEAIEKARKRVSLLIGCNDSEIVFTSGATESNNFIIKGYCFANREKGNHIIVSSAEHSSIMTTVRFLEKCGYEITYLKVDRNGLIDINELKNKIKNDTLLVSIMWANNELGSINDVEKIADICHERKVMFHTDATQYAGKGKIDLTQVKADFLTLSAHKFYGPKGVGIAYIRRNINGFFPKIEPLIHGGEQEFGLRGGTLPVHQIVGMGKAAEIAYQNLKNNAEILESEETLLKNKLLKLFGDKVIINNDIDNKIPGLLSVRFVGHNNQLLLKEISDSIAASSGSACSNKSPSHVLEACGYTDNEIRETIRFSLSPYSNYKDFKEIEE